MYILITILIVVASVLLTLLVLVQNSKGGGLASNFSSSNQIMGVRKTTDFIEKMTWGLVAFVALFSIIAAGLQPKQTTTRESAIQEQYQNARENVPGAIVPDFFETPEPATENNNTTTEDTPQE
ncbi:MAG: preprotein translocase subunit SecG [Prevotellaceae bacterium]|jgi:preprotein translocase subunit SecG|nr:preprotein translocase subunit SecG [Prevotellaceae bacterium]